MTLKTGTGQLPADVTGVPIQVPASFVCTDGTSPSPLTVAGTEIDLVVPANAVAFHCNPVGADCRVAIKDGTGTNYYIIRDGKEGRFPVASMAGLSVLRDAAVSVTLSYRFDLAT